MNLVNVLLVIILFIEPSTPECMMKQTNPTGTWALDQVQFYFPLPHHPWQRGTIENTNGLLRECFPKGLDITEISEEYIQAMYDDLNKRPRKCLGYKTPYEAYYSTSLYLT